MSKKKSKILVLDDDKPITEALQIALSVYGFEVKAMTNHLKLMATISQFKPDLVIIDYFLAGQAGTELVEQIKQDPKLKDLKIIMFSAHPSAKNDIDRNKIDAFVAKPFDINQLVQKITSLL